MTEKNSKGASTPATKRGAHADDAPIECDHLPKFATTAEACAWLESLFGGPWTLSILVELGLRPIVWIDDCPPYVIGFPATLPTAELFRLSATDTVLLSRARDPGGESHEFRPPRVYSRDALRFERHEVVHYAETSGLTPTRQRGQTVNEQWTEDDKRRMREMRASGVTEQGIAEKFGFSRTRLTELIGPKTKPRSSRTSPGDDLASAWGGPRGYARGAPLRRQPQTRAR